MINKSQNERTFALTVSGIEGLQWIGPQQVTLAGGESRNVIVSLSLDPHYAKKPVLDLTFSIQDIAEPDIATSQGNKFFAGR